MDSRDEVVSYDIVSKRFLRTVEGLFVRRCLKLLAKGKNAKDPLILDVGTGTANVPIRIIRKHPSAVIVAMDLSLNMLERARQNIADEKLQGCILLVTGDAENFPFKDDSFDLVYCHSMFHHLVNPLITAQGIIRVAKQGCCFIIRDLRRPPGFLLEWYVRIFGFRYDEMMKDFGGPDISGIGFAMGMERLLDLVPFEEEKQEFVYIVYMGEEAKKAGMKMAKRIREVGRETLIEYRERSLKNQMARANKFEASWVLIVGEDEVKRGKYQLKNMKSGEQIEEAEENILKIIREKSF